jgi:hypothetical protein
MASMQRDAGVLGVHRGDTRQAKLIRRLTHGAAGQTIPARIESWPAHDDVWSAIR